MNESKTTQLINEKNTGGELLKTFSSTVDATTTFPVASYPEYPVESEQEDWQFDGWSKTNDGTLDFAISGTTPLAIATWGASNHINNLYAHYTDISDPIKRRLTWKGNSTIGITFLNDLYTTGVKSSCTDNLFHVTDNYDLNSETNTNYVYTKKIVLRNYTGWSTDIDPVAEGKTLEEETGMSVAHVHVNNTYKNYATNAVTHLEVDIPNFKGRKHKSTANITTLSQCVSAGIYVNQQNMDNSTAPSANYGLIKNYQGLVLDCLSWKDGLFGDWLNLHADPDCLRLIAYLPELWGCIAGGPQEIFYPLLERDRKPYKFNASKYYNRTFPYSCYLWDAGYLNRISDMYLIPKANTKLRTLILHYAPDCPGYSEDWPICAYEITESESDYDIHPDCKVYVPESMLELYRADAAWTRTGVTFYKIEDCEARPDIGRNEDDWIRTEVGAMLWRFEEYNKLDTIKEKRLWLKSCAGKGNDYNIPDEYKFDYPDWYWDIDTVDEGEVTYGACNTSSRTKNVTSPYLQDIMMNTLTETLFNEMLTTVDTLGAYATYFGSKSSTITTQVIMNYENITLPSNITQIYREPIYVVSSSLKNVYVQLPDDLTINTRPIVGNVSSSQLMNFYYQNYNNFLVHPPYWIFGINNKLSRNNNVYINNELLTSITIDNDNYVTGLCYGNTAITSATLNCTTLKDYILGECVNLTDVTISDTVTSINKRTFYNCTGLESVMIGSSVTSIGEYAFGSCSSLTTLTIPSSVTSIGEGAFAWCSGLTSMTIPDTVTSINSYAFYYCSGLTSMTIPGSVTSIGNYAFSNCSSLTSMTIPGSVTSICNYAFSGCSGLTSVTIPNGVTYLGDSAFNGCRGLTSVTIPSGVTSIGSYTFYNCGSLTSVTIPSGVTSIGEYAFGSCNSLTSMTIPSSVTSIGVYAFNTCSKLSSIEFNSSISIESQAFYNNPLLATMKFNQTPLKLNHIFGFLGHILDMYFPSLEEYYNIEKTEFDTSTYGGSYYINYYFNNELYTDISFPNDMTTTPDYAFSYAKVTSINWNNITQLGKSFLHNAHITENIEIPANVIGCTTTSNFVKTEKVAQISFAEGKTTCFAGGSKDLCKFDIIDDYAGRIKTLVLPSTITKIEKYFINARRGSVYASYQNGIYIKIKATTPPTLEEDGIIVDDYLYRGTTFKILVPPGCADIYKGEEGLAKGWAELADCISEYTEE